MYERSAVVLERYLQTILGYKKKSNLKNNYKNYCKLVKDVENYQEACSKERKAVREYNSILQQITEIQEKQEKIYKKVSKFEYSRNIIFNNIEADVEEAEKCIVKIENSQKKALDEQVALREEFIEKVSDYQVKKENLRQCKENKKAAEEEYKQTLALTEENKQKIDMESVLFAREFIASENKSTKKELINVMLENGEEEKNPFDTDVIENAAILGIDIAKKEAESYLFIFDKTEKLLSDIKKKLIEINRFEKWEKDVTAKLNFLSAEKEYLVQFLDYERITVIHPKKVHRKLMLEACRNLTDDVNQINNLFELLLKEIAGKSTKKGYKLLYNKSYLVEMEKTDVDFQKQKDKININAGTIINSNYWRIEGVKNIYDTFEKDVYEIYGRSLEEFDIKLEEQVDESDDESSEIERFEKDEDLSDTYNISEEVFDEKSNDDFAEEDWAEEENKNDNVDFIFEKNESLENKFVAEDTFDNANTNEVNNSYAEENVEDTYNEEAFEENDVDENIYEAVEDSKEKEAYENYTNYDNLEKVEEPANVVNYDNNDNDIEEISLLDDVNEQDNYVTDFADNDIYEFKLEDLEDDKSSKNKREKTKGKKEKVGFFKKMSKINKRGKREAI